MVLNYIWIAFFLIAFVMAVAKLLFWGDTTVFPAMVSSTFDSAKTAFEISLGSLFGWASCASASGAVSSVCWHAG